MILVSLNTFWPALSAVLYAMNMCIAVYASASMIFSRQDPVKTLSWTAVMILLPYIGIVLYLTFGQNYRKKKMFKNLVKTKQNSWKAAQSCLRGKWNPLRNLYIRTLEIAIL